MDQFEGRFTEKWDRKEREDMPQFGDHDAYPMIMGQESVQKDGYSFTHNPSWLDNDLALVRVCHFFPGPKYWKKKKYARASLRRMTPSSG